MEGNSYSGREFRSPCIAATWDFGRLGIEISIPLLRNGASAVDAVEAAIRTVELDNQDQYYVGVGGYPNAEGKMELDAAIMDGDCRYGAVMSLPGISTPISVARTVMEKCPHNILTGDGALAWAKSMGFEETNILTDNVQQEWEQWRSSQRRSAEEDSNNVDDQHDTIGVICLDKYGRLSAGTSTSGYCYMLVFFCEAHQNVLNKQLAIQTSWSSWGLSLDWQWAVLR